MNNIKLNNGKEYHRKIFENKKICWFPGKSRCAMRWSVCSPRMERFIYVNIALLDFPSEELAWRLKVKPSFCLRIISSSRSWSHLPSECFLQFPTLQKLVFFHFDINLCDCTFLCRIFQPLAFHLAFQRYKIFYSLQNRFFSGTNLLNSILIVCELEI